MNERFRVVVRWAATILIGVAVGGLAGLLGGGLVATLTGAVVLFGCGLFVGATIWATYLPALGDPRRTQDTGEMEQQADLLGPGLFRAVALGFFGAGVCVGGLTAVGGVAVAIAGAAGLIVFLATAERPPADR
jgi:hypothetical protein